MGIKQNIVCEKRLFCYNQGMRIWALTFIFFLIPFAVKAQEITQEPICFNVINTADFKVYGSFITDYYTMPDGSRRRHTSNFRLEPKGDIDPKEGYPTDRAEFCSYGPFYPDRKLEFILRTIMPVFNCKTSVELGDIVIKGHRKAEGGVKMWAECL